MDKPTIGFIGLGRMGAILAKNLADDGHPLIVHNRTEAVATTFVVDVGAQLATTPAAVAEAADIVVLMLADGLAVLETIGGEHGLARTARPGLIVVDMGTSGHAATAEARRRLEECSAKLVEAPVSGSTAAATARTLLVMAAGRDADVESVRPVLEPLSAGFVHVGGPGAGAAMKLAVNAVLYSINGAIAESLVLAERAGVPRAVAYDVFASSAVAAPVVHYRRQVFEAPGSVPVTFSAALAGKDLGLIIELAEAVGAAMPQAVTNREVMRQVTDSGMGGADMGEVASFLRTRQ